MRRPPECADRPPRDGGYGLVVADLTWTVIHVSLGEGDEDPTFEPFAYTEGLTSEEELPNLWLSYRGGCGHRLGQEMAHFVVNETAKGLVDHGIELSGSLDVETAAGATIRIVLGAPLDKDECLELEVFPDDDGAVVPLSWTCSLDEGWSG